MRFVYLYLPFSPTHTPLLCPSPLSTPLSLIPYAFPQLVCDEIDAINAEAKANAKAKAANLAAENEVESGSKSASEARAEAVKASSKWDAVALDEDEVAAFEADSVRCALLEDEEEDSDDENGHDDESSRVDKWPSSWMEAMLEALAISEEAEELATVGTAPIKLSLKPKQRPSLEARKAVFAIEDAEENELSPEERADFARLTLAIVKDAADCKPSFDVELNRIGKVVNEKTTDGRAKDTCSISLAPLKNLKRALEKVSSEKYLGDATRITDICRGSICVSDLSQLLVAIQEVRRSEAFTPCAAKNRWVRRTRILQGYATVALKSTN